MKFLALLFLAAGTQNLVPVDEASYHKLLGANAGSVVLVDFWATWCAPCREELPALARLEAKLRAKGLKLVTISADEPEQERAAIEFLNKSGIPQPAYIRRAKDDDKFINAIDPKWSGALPALFLYDKKGVKRQTFIGETDPKQIEAAVQKLL